MFSRIKLIYPNGITTSYSYDNAGRLTNLLMQDSAHRIMNSYAYTLDKVGNRLTKTEPKVRYNYGYDSIYRLLESLPTELHRKEKETEHDNHDYDNDHKTETFTYDPVGNRLTGSRTKDTYNYNQGNQLVFGGKNQYEYDKNGNLIKKIEIDDDGDTEMWIYNYDYENRLTKVTKQDKDEITVVSFKYDPFERRIEKKVEEVDHGKAGESKTYTYIYDGESIVLEYLTKTDEGETKTETTRYIHGPGVDEHLALEQKDEIYYYHADGLGSITALTDKKQKVVQTYEYDSFGNLKDQKNRVKQPYTFTGRERDKEAGLYYYRTRYYDAKVGRFTSFDPILHFANGSKVRTCTQTTYYPTFEALKSEPYKLNPFVYVQNNPINEVDPTGLQSCNGEWRQQGFDRVFNFVCKCYWLCMPCEGIYWSGNFRELPFTIGSMINSPEGRGAGVRRGDACFCDKPGPDCECN